MLMFVKFELSYKPFKYTTMPTCEELERAKTFVILDFGPYVFQKIFGVEEIVGRLFDFVGMFNIGLSLLTKEGGMRAISSVKRNHGKIFYNGNFNDDSIEAIKQSVETVVAEGVQMFTVNMSSGSPVVRQAIESKGKSEVCVVPPFITSDIVFKAQHALNLGCDAILCSPEQLFEIGFIPELARLKKIVYGVRPAFIQGENHTKMTPNEAIRYGASGIIFCEDIMSPPKGMLPEEVAQCILEEIADIF